MPVNASDHGGSKSAPVLVELFVQDHLKSGPRSNSTVSCFRPISSKCSCQKKINLIVCVEWLQDKKSKFQLCEKIGKMSC